MTKTQWGAAIVIVACIATALAVVLFVISSPATSPVQRAECQFAIGSAMDADGIEVFADATDIDDLPEACRSMDIDEVDELLAEAVYDRIDDVVRP